MLCPAVQMRAPVSSRANLWKRVAASSSRMTLPNSPAVRARTGSAGEAFFFVKSSGRFQTMTTPVLNDGRVFVRPAKEAACIQIGAPAAVR